MAEKKDSKSQNLSGMFGLDGIMDEFYSYKPGDDDEYGKMIKNTFATNMIQSGFDTQNAKDLAFTQAEISTSQMKDAADLQLRNTQDIMKAEYDFGSGLMGQQYELQNKASDNQHSRDLGLLAAQGTQARETASQQQASDQKIASGRYDADKIVANTQAEASKYGAKQSADASKFGATESRKASEFGATASKEASMYGAKQSADASKFGATESRKASEFGATASKEASMYGAKQSADASKYGADKSSEASKYGADKSAQASMYGAKQSADASKYGADKSAQASMYGADKSAQASMYGADRQLDATRDTNRTSTENIKVTGDQTRKTQNNEQRLRAKDRANMHGYARRTARAY